MYILTKFLCQGVCTFHKLYGSFIWGPTLGDLFEDPMPILEMLPCLVVLELHQYTPGTFSFAREFLPGTMSFGAQGFPRLQELRLVGCDFNKWTMEVGTLPKLSFLSFIHCDLWEEIPDGLLHLPSLRFISMNTLKDYPNDSTLDGLRQKGCEVTLPPSSLLPSFNSLLFNYQR